MSPCSKSTRSSNFKESINFCQRDSFLEQPEVKQKKSTQVSGCHTIQCCFEWILDTEVSIALRFAGYFGFTKPCACESFRQVYVSCQFPVRPFTWRCHEVSRYARKQGYVQKLRTALKENRQFEYCGKCKKKPRWVWGQQCETFAAYPLCSHHRGIHAREKPHDTTWKWNNEHATLAIGGANHLSNSKRTLRTPRRRD